MDLPSKEQIKLIFEFLIQKQKFVDFAFVDFVEEKVATGYNKGDLVFDGESIFVIHRLSLDQYVYCERVMSRYKRISCGEYESGVVNFRTHANDDDFDDPYSESELVRLKVEQLQKLDTIHLLCGYEKFGTGRLKKTPTYIASIDNVSPSCLFNSTSKIGKIKVA